MGCICKNWNQAQKQVLVTTAHKMTLYSGLLCLHMWGLQASLEALQMRLALSCRPPLIHRDILICRAASNPGAS